MRGKPASIFVTLQWKYRSLNHSFLFAKAGRKKHTSAFNVFLYRGMDTLD